MALETAPMANLFGTSRDSGFGMNSNSIQRLINDVGALGLCPLGTILAWHKTFGLTDSGVCDSIGADTKVLRQTGQNFLTTVQVGMTAVNESLTPILSTIVVEVVSNTELRVKDDIFDDTHIYKIYKNVELPPGWLECNGQVIDDQDSIFDGETLPELLTAERFLKGDTTSGQVGGALSKTTSIPSATAQIGAGAPNGADRNHSHTITDIRPPYFVVVWIMRIK